MFANPLETLFRTSATGHQSKMIDDPNLMEYAIKGTDSQWNEALKDKDGTKTINGTVQIKSNHAKQTKRKLTQEDIEKEINGAQTEPKKKKRTKKKKSSKA